MDNSTFNAPLNVSLHFCWWVIRCRATCLILTILVLTKHSEGVFEQRLRVHLHRLLRHQQTEVIKIQTRRAIIYFVNHVLNLGIFTFRYHDKQSPKLTSDSVGFCPALRIA